MYGEEALGVEVAGEEGDLLPGLLPGPPGVGVPLRVRQHLNFP